MNKIPNLEIAGRRAFYRPSGKVSFEQAVETVAGVMRSVREQGCTELLANVSGLTGFPSPSTVGRYSMALRWAESAGSTLRVAMVVRPDVMDPEKIGVLMAQNRGVSGDVFLTEAAALAWLDSRAVGKP